MDDRDYVLNRRAVVDRITSQGPYWYALSQVIAIITFISFALLNESLFPW
jgi:hypothetical protein